MPNICSDRSRPGNWREQHSSGARSNTFAAGVPPAVPPPTLVPKQHGAYYALVIGIKNYQSLPKLETPVNDANAVAEVLRQRYGFEVNLLLDASRHQILNFAGTWTETNPRDPAHPRKLVLQQDGGQIAFAGFHLTLSQSVATYTGPQGCAPELQHSGYNYGSSGMAGTTTLKISIEGSILVYENDANWQAPCDGHRVGIEQDISRFQRVTVSR
jgi:hypothetical protein